MNKPVVLVVDDDHKILRLLRTTLTPEFQVVQAERGADALEILERQRPDIMVLDIIMPGMDGLEVLRTIRSHPMHKDLPIIVYSARDDAETIDEAFKSGAQDYLVKSQSDFERVHTCIEEHLGPVN